MGRKKLVDGKLLDVPSVSGRGAPSVASGAGGGMHTTKNAEQEDAIFKQLLHKRRDEQEQTAERFVNDDRGDQYPLIGELVDTWEELCLSIMK